MHIFCYYKKTTRLDLNVTTTCFFFFITIARWRLQGNDTEHNNTIR